MPNCFMLRATVKIPSARPFSRPSARPFSMKHGDRFLFHHMRYIMLFSYSRQSLQLAQRSSIILESHEYGTFYLVRQLLKSRAISSNGHLFKRRLRAEFISPQVPDQVSYTEQLIFLRVLRSLYRLIRIVYHLCSCSCEEVQSSSIETPLLLSRLYMICF